MAHCGRAAVSYILCFMPQLQMKYVVSAEEADTVCVWHMELYVLLAPLIKVIAYELVASEWETKIAGWRITHAWRQKQRS